MSGCPFAVARTDARLRPRRPHDDAARSFDAARLYYDRKYATAPPGTEVDLRYASILAELGLPGRPQHDAFEDALGAAEMYLVLDDMKRRGARLRRERRERQDQFALA